MRQNDDRFNAPEIPQVNALGNGLNYVIPTELVELPSKGYFYPPGHPLHRKEYIEIKHMTAKEEDILTSSSLIEKGVVLDYLIQSLLIDKSINSKTLLAGDRSAILLNARINAYGEDYKFQTSCTKCSSLIEAECDLSTIKAKENNESSLNDSGHIETILPKSEVSVSLRFLSTHEEEILTKEMEKKKKLGLGDSPVTTFLRYILFSINGHKNDGSSQMQNFIDNMPSKDVKFLQKKYIEAKPDVDFMHDIECNSCGHVERREVPLTADFFWP